MADDLAWLPVIFLFQFFVSRQPLLSLGSVTVPVRAWLSAPKDAPDLAERRVRVLSVLTHPQVVLVGLMVLGVAGWITYFAQG